MTPQGWDLPWRIERRDNNKGTVVDYLVPLHAEPTCCGTWWPSAPIFDEGLEAFIAHRVNTYDVLVAALKAVALSPSTVCTGEHPQPCDCVGDRVREAIRDTEGR